MIINQKDKTMKTLLFCFALACTMTVTVAEAQKRKKVDYPARLPKDLELDNSTIRNYIMTTDYFDYDLKGNFIRKRRVTGEYTGGLDGDSARWNGVYISEAGELKAPFPEGSKLEYMENFTYHETEQIIEEDFFEAIPEANMLVKNLIWDVFGFEIFAYSCWDSLKRNEEYHAHNLNSEIELAGEGTFENRDIILTWIGLTELNNEICAIIKYSVMNNPLKIELDNFTMSGRSHYWGEVYVSLTDKQIEYATLSEDVVTDILFKGQSNNILGYTVRNINLSKVN
jgi:hypothetical protein